MIESKVNGNSISQHLQEPYLCTNRDFFFFQFIFPSRKWHLCLQDIFLDEKSKVQILCIVYLLLLKVRIKNIFIFTFKCIDRPWKDTNSQQSMRQEKHGQRSQVRRNRPEAHSRAVDGFPKSMVEEGDDFA